MSERQRTKVERKSSVDGGRKTPQDCDRVGVLS